MNTHYLGPAVMSLFPSLHGTPKGASSTEMLADVVDVSGRRLLIAVEPVAANPGSDAVAHRALAAFQKSFLNSSEQPTIGALLTAFQIANREIRNENGWMLAGDRWQVLVGLTALAIDRSQLVIAIAPPGQALVIQTGDLFAFPSLSSWQSGFEGNDDQPSCAPLGVAEDIRPAIYSTRVAPGDAILVGNSCVGRSIAHSFETGVETEDSAALVARLAVFLGSKSSGLRAILLPIDELSGDIAAATPRIQPAVSPGRDDVAVQWTNPRIRRAIYFDRLRTKLIEFTERIGSPPDPPVLPLEAKVRAARPTGAGHVHLYRGSGRQTGSPHFRTRSPRLPLRGRAFAMLFVLLLVASALYAGYDYKHARASKAEFYLSAADAHVAAVATANDSVAADLELTKAEEALNSAIRSGASDALVAQRRAVVAAARDATLNIDRFTDVTRLGDFPASIDKSSLHLVSDGSDLFLVAGAVYKVDTEARALVRLLGPGTVIDGQTAGNRFEASVDGDVLMVSDGSTLFRHYRSGRWTSSRLGASAGIEATAGAAFLGSFYVLDAKAADILKYDAQKLGHTPTSWLAKDRSTRPVGAIDFAIDGNIYVLEENCDIVTYFKGAVKSSFSLEVRPPLSRPVALSGGSGSAFLYLGETNGAEGRIVRFDRQGGSVRQFLMPDPQRSSSGTVVPDLASIRDFVVDEANSRVYVADDSGIWQASLPPTS